MSAYLDDLAPVPGSVVRCKADITRTGSHPATHMKFCRATG